MAMATKNRKLLNWIAEIEALCKPDRVYWCDGSQAEYDRLLGETVASGAAVALNPSKRPGSVAAPTAGLHFSDRVLKEIKAKGPPVESVTLHVGYGTFKPVSIDEVARHKLEPEVFELNEETALRLNDMKRKGGKIFAVGTTTCRVLENQARFVKGS